MGMKQRVTVAEAAEILEVTPAMIRRFCKSGQLGKVMQDGKRSVYLIYRNQVEKIKNDPVGAGSDYEVSKTGSGVSDNNRIPQFLRKNKR